MIAPIADATTFGAALREWRRRRRLSQLELALAAATSQRHLSFLESGRARPGRGMVVRLGEALELNLRERNALLLRAGFAPAYPERELGHRELAGVRPALERVLAGHEPFPAVIVDRLGDLVAANAAFDAMVADAAPALLEPPVFVARLMLHPDGLGSRIVNFDRWAFHVLDALAREVHRHPDEELVARHDELVVLAGERPVVTPDHLGFAVPLELHAGRSTLRLVTTLTTFATATDVTLAELRLEAFLPADAETAAALHAAAGGSTATPAWRFAAPTGGGRPDPSRASSRAP